MRPRIVNKIAIMALCFFASATLLGQANGGNSGPPEPGQTRGPQLPIDDNLMILLVIGLIYGGYIAFRSYRSKNIPA